MKGVLLLACPLLGCATGVPLGSGPWSAFREFAPASSPRQVPSDVPSRPAVLSEEDREPVVAAARAMVGTRAADDCSGLVRGVFRTRSVDVLMDAAPSDNGVTAIFRFALGRGRVFTGGHPLPGDLVFFKNTHDQNGDGKANDGLTHVGLVESIDPDGTVTVIHRVKSGVVRYRMNLLHPSWRKDPRTGQALNDYLRPPGQPHASVLTGELFAAYATLFTRSAPVAIRSP